ncbi:MAG TPA: flippase activity-associated protein Agl23, partial [Planctomycetota bacterium]|nr:flippase activity-associated protein Agl23 [Planctomycetota bacterium]
MHRPRLDLFDGRGGIEWAFWLVLLGVSVALRLFDLGSRVMSHDESIHAFYAFELLRKGTYVHDPVYHGPLLYHLNALVFFFLGASDATARVSSALAGVGLVAACWLWRPFLGRAGAFAAALLVALSPTLLFYSRQVWMDIHVALFTLVWIYGAFRYLATRGRRWLALVTLAMALAFAAKEVSFIFGAILGAWLLVEAFASRRADPARAAAAGDLAVLMLGLVLPFASGAGYLAFGWNVRSLHAAGTALVIAHFVAAGLLVWLWIKARGRLLGPGLSSEERSRSVGLRLRDWAALTTLYWSVALLLFTTFLTNLRGGLASGIVGSLGYWLTQQEVARGSQPWFYYLMLGALYDLAPLLVGGIAFFAAAARLRRPLWDPAAGDLPLTSPLPEPGRQAATNGSLPDRAERRAFLSFLLWWTLATWCAYLVAGEKMPWLMTHMVLPVCLVAGWGVGRVAFAATRDRRWNGALLLVGGGLVGPALLARWIASEPFAGETTQAVAETMEWFVRGGVIAVLAALMLRAALRAGTRQAGRLVALGVAGLLLALTVRAGLRLCYLNHDLATEHLSYAQGSPDVKRAMREIQLISERSAGDRELFVAYDDQSSWPFVWYLR